MLRLFLGTLYLGIPTAAAEPTSTVSDWDIRMMRVQGAAADVRRAAEDIEILAKKISDSKHLNRFPALKTELDDLEKMVSSAHLAVEVASESKTTP